MFCEDCCKEYGPDDSTFPMTEEKIGEIVEFVIEGDQWKIQCPRCKGANVAVAVRRVVGIGRPNL